MINYENVSNLVLEAEKAVKTLEEYQRPQIETKKQTILEQVCDYIYQILDDCNWIHNSPKYFDSIYLDGRNILYVGNSTALSSMKPVARFMKGNFEIFNELTEDESLVLIHNWERFKVVLDKSIKEAIEKKQNKINQNIAHIAYIQKELDSFKI